MANTRQHVLVVGAKKTGLERVAPMLRRAEFSVHSVEPSPFLLDLVLSTAFELVIERLDLQFVPGDCVALGMDNSGETRPYSIASGVDEPVVRFVIRVMPDGMLTPRLLKSRAGDSVSVSPPFGWFRPGQDWTLGGVQALLRIHDCSTLAGIAAACIGPRSVNKQIDRESVSSYRYHKRW